MKEFRPVTTVRELLMLDEDDIRDGYRAACLGNSPTSACSRGYWHGWREGMVDAGLEAPSAEMLFLKSEQLMTIHHSDRLQ